MQCRECSVCEDICPDEPKNEDNDDDDNFRDADRDIIITTSRRRRPVFKRQQQRRQRKSQTAANTTSENKKNENQSGRGFAGEMGKYLASFVLSDASARIADPVLPASQLGGVNPFARVGARLASSIVRNAGARGVANAFLKRGLGSSIIRNASKNVGKSMLKKGLKYGAPAAAGSIGLAMLLRSLGGKERQQTGGRKMSVKSLTRLKTYGRRGLGLAAGAAAQVAVRTILEANLAPTLANL